MNSQTVIRLRLAAIAAIAFGLAALRLSAPTQTVPGDSAQEFQLATRGGRAVGPVGQVGAEGREIHAWAN